MPKSKLTSMADIDTVEHMAIIWRKIGVPTKEISTEFGLLLMNAAISISMDNWYKSKTAVKFEDREEE